MCDMAQKRRSGTPVGVGFLLSEVPGWAQQPLYLLSLAGLTAISLFLSEEQRKPVTMEQWLRP